MARLRRDWWALPLRLIVGYGFMEHGFAKLARGPESFTAILHALHMPAAPLLAWATILTELIGGLAVLVLGGSGPFALDAVLRRHFDFANKQVPERRSACDS